MFDKALFRAKLIEKNLTCAEVAMHLDINPATLSRKMNSISEFTRTEIQTLIRLLGLTSEETAGIFFKHKLVETQE